MSTTTETWTAVVGQLAASGLTIREFARQHGYNRSTLSWWRWRLKDQLPAIEKTETAFVELVPREPREPRESRRSTPVRIRPDGRPWVIEVEQDSDLDLVARLLERVG